LTVDFYDQLRRRPNTTALVGDAWGQAWVRRHPHAVINTMTSIAEKYHKSLFSFKLFPGHLSTTNTLATIGDLRPFIVFISREPIDTFISLKKAREAGGWSGINTSEMRVTLDVDEFLSWHVATQEFLTGAWAAAERFAAGCAQITYREIYGGGDPAEIVVRRKLESLGIDLGRSAIVDSLPRQDHSEGRAKKVKNWGAFENEMARRGLAHRLEFFDFTGGRRWLRFEEAWARAQVKRAWQKIRRRS
jgi:hypothetical protein